MDDMNHRLVRLEEQHAFVERSAEQLSGELRLAYEQIERLMHRLDSLERRLADASTVADEPTE